MNVLEVIYCYPRMLMKDCSMETEQEVQHPKSSQPSIQLTSKRTYAHLHSNLKSSVCQQKYNQLALSFLLIIYLLSCEATFNCHFFFLSNLASCTYGWDFLLDWA